MNKEKQLKKKLKKLNENMDEIELLLFELNKERGKSGFENSYIEFYFSKLNTRKRLYDVLEFLDIEMDNRD